MTKLPSVPGNNLGIEMAKTLQKFLPQTDTTVADCQEKKGSVRTKIIAVIYTNSGKAFLREGESRRWGELVSGRWEMGDGENFYLQQIPR